MKFRNASVTHKVAELLVIFADLGPDECKNATDEVLDMVSLIPQDLWMRSAEFYKATSTSSWTVQEHNNKAMKNGAVDFTQGRVEVKGDEQRQKR